MTNQTLFRDRTFYFLLVLGLLLNATGLFNEILEPDGALYAGIAKRMVTGKDWINLYADGYDWLDKPHLPFWIAAASFKCLGISAFAYKLPAFLFWLLGIRFTWLLALNLMNRTVAMLAVLVYITALHTVIANFDVRAEPYLTSFCTGAIYYMLRAWQTGRLLPLVAAAICAACAIMTKGIFVLATIAGGFVIYWLISKQWKQCFHFRWWLLFFLILIFILPELYCLYQQFDLHPEKIVFGRTNVSGLRFFFWDSQFGRFFNTGPIKGRGDYLFFVHTTIWAFLPWSVLLFSAVYLLLRKKWPMQPLHWIVSGSALISFLLFSFSRFQLPHYIVLIFPQLAILTGAFLFSMSEKGGFIRRFGLVQACLNIILALLLIYLIWLCRFPGAGIWLILILLLLLLSLMIGRKRGMLTLLTRCFGFGVLLYSFLNLYFYPQLLRYQSGMMAGKWLNQQHAGETVVMYKTYSYSLEFYAGKEVKRIGEESALRGFLQNNEAFVFCTKEVAEELKQHGLPFELFNSFPHFKVSQLRYGFLDADTRAGECGEMVVVKMAQQ